MAPALAQPASAEGDEDPDREHLRIALGFRGGVIEEGADAGILFVDEVPTRATSASVELKGCISGSLHIHQVFGHIVEARRQ